MGRAWRSMIWFRTPRLHSTIPLYHFHFGFRTRCSHCFLSSHLFPPKKDHKQAICFFPWQWHTTQAESFAFHEWIFSLWKKDMRVKGPSVWELRQRCTMRHMRLAEFRYMLASHGPAGHARRGPTGVRARALSLRLNWKSGISIPFSRSTTCGNVILVI
jgi:hypothetical protein